MKSKTGIYIIFACLSGMMAMSAFLGLVQQASAATWQPGWQKTTWGVDTGYGFGMYPTSN